MVDEASLMLAALAVNLVAGLFSALACLTLSLFGGNEHAKPPPNQPNTPQKLRQNPLDQQAARPAPPRPFMPDKSTRTVVETPQSPRQSTDTQPQWSTAASLKSLPSPSKSQGKYPTSEEDFERTQFEQVAAAVRPAVSRSSSNRSRKSDRDKNETKPSASRSPDEDAAKPETTSVGRSRGKYATSEDDMANTEFESVAAVIRPALSRKDKADKDKARSKSSVPQKSDGTDKASPTSKSAKSELDVVARPRAEHKTAHPLVEPWKTADGRLQQRYTTSTFTPMASKDESGALRAPTRTPTTIHSPTSSCYFPVARTTQTGAQPQQSVYLPAPSAVRPPPMPTTASNTSTNTKPSQCSDAATPVPTKTPPPPPAPPTSTTKRGKYATDEDEFVASETLVPRYYR